MKKLNAKCYIFLFVLIFILPSLVFGVFNDKIPFVNYEQRELAQKPDLTVAAIAEYPSDFENYYNDNLPFRTQLIETNTYLNYRIFRKSPVDQVIIGKDGWLFYDSAVKNDGDTMADYYGKNFYSEANLKQLAAHLVSVRDKLAKKGKEFVIFITQNKVSVYGQEFLPDSYERGSGKTRADQVVEYLKHNTDLRVVYSKDAIIPAKEKYPQYDFYYKYDTHWNSLGAYMGASLLLNELGINTPDISTLSVEKQVAKSCDLANMMGMTAILGSGENYVVKGLPISDEEVTVTQTEFISKRNIKGKKLFLIRDSYTTALAPYLYPHFSQCYMPHISAYSPEMIEKQNPDIVVYETVERYIDGLFNFNVE